MKVASKWWQIEVGNKEAKRVWKERKNESKNKKGKNQMKKIYVKNFELFRLIKK